MAVFGKNEAQGSQRMVSEMINKINDNIRRLRVIEQRIKSLDIRTNSIEQNILGQNKNMQKMFNERDVKITAMEDRVFKMETVMKEMVKQMKMMATKSNIDELKTCFNSVIEWVSSVFTDVEKEMRGLEWGRLYEEFHSESYDPAKVSVEVHRLYGDPFVKNRRGVFEYILGGLKDPRLLDVRVFDEATKRATYASQTTDAEDKGESNCPLCAVGYDANKSKIWEFAEMDADHVSAWNKGGETSAENCQMLCVTHNRAKGNR